MLRDALLVMGKDLRIEARAKITLRQVAPFVVTVMVLFAFGLDRVLVRAPNVADTVTDSVPVAYVVPGLIWLALLFALLLVVARSVSIEEEDGAGDALRLSGLDPAGIFLGKAGAIAVQLLGLEVLLIGGSVLFFQARLAAPLLLISATLLATVGLAAVGTCYGALSSGIRSRETLLPVLVMPVVSPVVLAGVQAWQKALLGEVGDGWPWVRLLMVFAVVYLSFGVLAYGALLEES
jgi:heme exporter protein B